MEEGKSFGFEKPKTMVHIVSFRLDDKHWQTLEELFNVLEINPKKNTITNKMLMLIDRAESMRKTIIENKKSMETLKSEHHDKIEALKKEKQTLGNKVRLYEKEIAEMEREVERMAPATKTALTKESTKSEAVTPTQMTQKPLVITKEEAKTSETFCPAQDKPIPKTECDKCARENFKMFSECYTARNRIRIGKATEQDLALFKEH